MRPWRCDSRLLECLPKFSESHLHVSDPILRVVVCHTPRLASTFRAEFIPSIPRCLCPATPCGVNDSVRTQCLGVAFGGLTLECTLMSKCSSLPYQHLVIMQRAAARVCSSQLRFVVCVRDGAMCRRTRLENGVSPSAQSCSCVLSFVEPNRFQRMPRETATACQQGRQCTIRFARKTAHNAPCSSLSLYLLK